MRVAEAEEIDQPEHSHDNGKTQAEHARNDADPPLPAQNVKGDEYIEGDREKHRSQLMGGT